MVDDLHNDPADLCPNVISGSDSPDAPFACVRVAGHPGECIAIVCDAAEADGVCWGCRFRLEFGHGNDCRAVSP